MSKMKMSDVFEGRVVLDSSCGKVGGGCLEIGDDLGWIAHVGIHNERDINESNEAAIHAIYAINNHDRMVEEIAALKGAIEAAVRIKELWLPTIAFSDNPPEHYAEIEALHKMANKFEIALAKLSKDK